MDSIGGMLNLIGKMNFVLVILEKANGIFLETIGISVMVSIGLLLFLSGER